MLIRNFCLAVRRPDNPLQFDEIGYTHQAVSKKKPENAVFHLSACPAPIPVNIQSRSLCNAVAPARQLRRRSYIPVRQTFPLCGATDPARLKDDDNIYILLP